MGARERYRVIRRKTSKAKYNWFAELAVGGSGLARHLLERKGRRLCDINTISSSAVATFQLASSSPQTRIPPAFGIACPASDISTHSPINAYLLNDVITSAKTSLISANEKLLVPKEFINQREILVIEPGAVGYFNPRYAIRYIQTYHQYENAILIGGNGSSNWYHYLIEVAPKAFLASLLPEKFNDFPLIVPKPAQSAGPFSDILQSLLPGRPILNFSNDSIHVRNLIVFDEVSHGPFNLDSGLWPKTPDYSQHENVLWAVFEKMRTSLLPVGGQLTQTRRFFIVRPDTRRSYNQTELLKIAQKFSFEPISPETLSLREQALLFAEASHVVGASGAAWTNMVFAPLPFKALTWVIPQYHQFCSYSMLAHLLGHQLHYLVAEPNKKIRSTHDAFSASYCVSPIEFEAALTRLTEEN